MDRDKVDRLEAALATALFVQATDEAATAREALLAAQRLFAGTLAAFVFDADRTYQTMSREIDAHGHDAVTIAQARLLRLCEGERAAGDEPC